MVSLKWALNAWKFFCCLGLLIAIIIETEKYLKNEGKVSSVDHRIFHQSKNDRYPAFSICLEMRDTYDFSFNTQSNIDKLQLLGTEMPFSNDSFLLNTTAIFNNAQIQHAWANFGDRWIRSEIDATQIPPSNGPKPFDHNQQFYENPNIPRRYCLTRNNSREATKELIKNYDVIILNKTLLLEHDVNLMLYIHHPGQLMRSYHKHVLWAVLSPNSTGAALKALVFQLVFVSVSRLRESANIGCIDDDGMEDIYRRKVIKGKLNISDNYQIKQWRFNLGMC